MTRLSINVNKIATLRNARGGNNPNIVEVGLDCERFGAQGITVHPRPDERHIRYTDVFKLKDVITTEFNIEGYPDRRYLDLVKKAKPAQATLVPDAVDVVTSNAGWDTMANTALLTDICQEIKDEGIRISIFVYPNPKMVEGALEVGADRVELYTEPYATNYHRDKDKAIGDYLEAASVARAIGLEVNAGHDLDSHNLRFLKESIPYLTEVSIGHALICDALYYGLENTIGMYLRLLKDTGQE